MLSFKTVLMQAYQVISVLSYIHNNYLIGISIKHMCLAGYNALQAYTTSDILKYHCKCSAYLLLAVSLLYFPRQAYCVLFMSKQNYDYDNHDYDNSGIELVLALADISRSGYVVIAGKRQTDTHSHRRAWPIYSSRRLRCMHRFRLFCF